MPKDSETAGLSEEERAALEEDEDTGTDALKDIADGEDDDDPDFGKDVEAKKKDEDDDKPDGDNEGDDEGADAKAKAKDDEEGDDDEESDEDEAEASAPTDAFTPLLNVQQPENFDERMGELNKREEELDAQFENDDIKWADYRKQQREIHTEQRNLQKEKDDADFAERQNDTISRQRWLWEVERFVQDTDDIDYRGDEAMRKQLDTAVRVVAQTDEASSMTGRQILEEADKWVRARNNITKSAPAGEEGKGGEKKKDQASGKRKPDLSVVPTTLSNVPAAAENETGKEKAKWAELDKLADTDPMAHERALAKLSKSEQEEYLSSGTG